MVKYIPEFKYQAVKRALKQGIKPIIRELKISGNTLRKWLRDYKKEKMRSFIKYHQSYNRNDLALEQLVVSLKEENPRLTLKKIQRIIRERKGQDLSLNGIYGTLERYGMAGKYPLALRRPDTLELQKYIRLAQSFIEKENIEESAKVLNSLPALSDFSILEKIPSQFLSPRRQAEQLETCWSNLPMAEMYKRAAKLHQQCEKKKLLFTGMFVITLMMNALNFLGHRAKVFSLYKRYCKYLPRLPLSLRYAFLTECFISRSFAPKKGTEKIFKDFPYKLERFCANLPEGKHRVRLYDAMSACFQLKGDLGKSLIWMEKLLQEVPAKSKKKYLMEYHRLLATKGDYSEILDFRESLENIPSPFYLWGLIAQGYALLGIGRQKEALDLALNGFLKAKKDHLLSAIQGFIFFLSCCYSALKETEKAKQYLKLFLSFSKDVVKYKKLCALLLGFTPPALVRIAETEINLVNLYLLACKNLNKRDYLKAYRFAEKKGLLGFLHRIMLLHPEAVINLLHKGKETYLPKEFLALPVFKKEVPIFKLFLLKDNEAIFYGDRKIDISYRAKDFHLFVCLFLNRKRYFDRKNLSNIFYRKTENPSKSLTVALSKIRKNLNFNGALTSKKGGVFLNIEAWVDLEEFEERFKIGKILGKAGEVERALLEYQECFKLYKKSPFEKMGYYYNFAEERRIIGRNMYQELCNSLLRSAREKKNFKLVNKITNRLKQEGLLFNQNEDNIIEE